MFSVKSGSPLSAILYQVTEGGNWQSDGDGTISGNDLDFDGVSNPVDIYTNSSDGSMGMDIAAQGGIDIVIDSDGGSLPEFRVKAEGDGTARLI